MSDNRYIKSIVPSNKWVRPQGWLPLDTVTNGTNNFSGLFAVYETQKNVCTIQINFPSGTRLINWGDGTTQTAVTGAIYTKVYDYATLSSVILVDDFGYNYKMVVVNIILTSATSLLIERNTTATLINNVRALGWLDIALDCSTLTFLILSQQARSIFLQRLLIYNTSSSFIASDFTYLQSLRILKFPYPNSTGITSMFANFIGDIRDENNLPINLNFTGITGSNNFAFQKSRIQKLGNITANSATNLTSFLQDSIDLTEIGTISATSCTNITSFINGCVNLVKIGNITTSSSLTSINSFSAFNRKIKSINISNCTNVTNYANAFLENSSLENLILTGATRGFTIDDCNMSATAIDALFTSLGTASGAQTINVRRNPGSATCTTSIATLKGYTVIIA